MTAILTPYEAPLKSLRISEDIPPHGTVKHIGEVMLC